MQQYKIKIMSLLSKILKMLSDYIAFVLLNPSAAENTVKGIREQVNKLRYFPDSHELDEDPMLAELGVRTIIF